MIKTYLTRQHVTSSNMELFERAVTFVKFFSFLFSSGLSVFVHLMVSYLYVFMNFSFIQSAPW